MLAKDINQHSKEGRLLIVAVSVLINSGPEETKGKEPDEVIQLLDQAADALSHFKM